MRASISLILSVIAGCAEEPPEDPGGPFLEPECAFLLDCAAEVDPGSVALHEATYGAGGECFASASEERDCLEACNDLSAGYLADNPTAVACWPNGDPDAPLLFSEVDEEWLLSAGYPCETGHEAGSVSFRAEEPGPGFQARFTPSGGYSPDLELECAFSYDPESAWEVPFSCGVVESPPGVSWTVSGSLVEDYRVLWIEAVVEFDTGPQRCFFSGGPAEQGR